MGKIAETWWHQASDPVSLFTLGLVLVGLAQLFLFLWQLRLIRESLTDAKEAAQAGTTAATAASRQALVAEESLTKLERPYLFVFNVSALKTEEIEQGQEDDGYYLTVTYSVANYGKIPAIIKHIQVGFSVDIVPIVPPLVGYHHELVTSPILAPNELRKEIAETLRWTGGVQNDEYQSLYPVLENTELFFWVILNYRGPFTDEHETRACWRYDLDTNRFVGSLTDFSWEK
jgi:hypothetical protein